MRAIYRKVESVARKYDKKLKSYPICEITGKRQYDSQEHAEVMSKFLPARFPGRDNVTTLRAYCCEHCDMWHLTHKPKDERFYSAGVTALNEGVRL